MNMLAVGIPNSACVLYDIIFQHPQLVFRPHILLSYHIWILLISYHTNIISYMIARHLTETQKANCLPQATDDPPLFELLALKIPLHLTDSSDPKQPQRF